MTSVPRLLLVLSYVLPLCHAFVAPHRLTLTRVEPLAAKQRRRRKDASSSSPTDDLPDFDVDSVAVPREPPVVAAPPPRRTAQPTIQRGLSNELASDLGGNVDGLDPDVILSTMRGRQGESWIPPRSMEETLRDRSLEQYMDFDRMVQEDREASGGGSAVVELPTMEDVISRRKLREGANHEETVDTATVVLSMDTTGMSKKAAKRAERKAAAIQREQDEESEGMFRLEGLNVLKLLENGAWVGIGLLIVWEIYINSPFFDRAAPLIPAVFE